MAWYLSYLFFGIYKCDVSKLLHHFALHSGEEYIGHRLLRRLGWRYGEGIGPRAKKARRTRGEKQGQAGAPGRIVGCALPEGFEPERDKYAARHHQLWGWIPA